MNTSVIDKEQKKLTNEYTNFFKQKDDQTLFYFIQMNEIMYDELGYEISNKELLYDLVCNNFRSNINIIFKNLKDYYLKLTTTAISSFNDVIKISASNKYIDSNNIKNMYRNFKYEIDSTQKLNSKINDLVFSNAKSLIGQIYTSLNFKDSTKVSNIINKYIKIITEEMIKNITVKNDYLLSSYKSFIDNLLEDSEIDKKKMREMNLKVITNTTYIYLKEQEYFVIDKYINDNFSYINKAFEKLEENLQKEINVKRAAESFNKAKDYLLGFNNTIDIKTKKIFDEMNLAITLEDSKLNQKMKEFNDLISHIYELDLNFDKQFMNYKKSFNTQLRDLDKFDKIFDQNKKKITDHIKSNISTIFRENVKTYNDVIYRYLLLKNKVNDFNEVLSEGKVKDLLFK